MTPAGDYLPFTKAGKLRVLATSGNKRAPYLPDVPTFAEQGFPEIVRRRVVRLLSRRPRRRPPSIAARQRRDHRRAEGPGGHRRLSLSAWWRRARRPRNDSRSRASTSAGARWSSRSASPPNPERDRHASDATVSRDPRWRWAGRWPVGPRWPARRRRPGGRRRAAPRGRARPGTLLACTDLRGARRRAPGTVVYSERRRVPAGTGHASATPACRRRPTAWCRAA